MDPAILDLSHDSLPDTRSGSRDLVRYAMSDAADRATERAHRMTVRRFASAAEADCADRDYWQQIPEKDRALEAWRLSQQLWRLKGDPPHEPGLRRSVARVQRR